MSTRRATAAARAPAAAGTGTNRAAQLLAYNGPVIERNASEYPASAPVGNPFLLQTVNSLQSTLATIWIPKVQVALQKHKAVHEYLEDPGAQAESSRKTQDYMNLVGLLQMMYQQMAYFVTDANAQQAARDEVGFLTSLVQQLQFPDQPVAYLLSQVWAGYY